MLHQRKKKSIPTFWENETFHQEEEEEEKKEIHVSSLITNYGEKRYFG